MPPGATGAPKQCSSRRHNPARGLAGREGRRQTDGAALPVREWRSQALTTFTCKKEMTEEKHAVLCAHAPHQLVSDSSSTRTAPASA